jgi:hypothetical protein
LTWKSCFTPLPDLLNSCDVSSMQASLFNTALFPTNSSDTPSHPPSTQEPTSSQVDLDMQALDMPNFSSHGTPLHVINTVFDHDHTFNKKLGFPPKNKKKRYRYTQKERGHVEHARRCVSLQDFKAQVSNFCHYINLLNVYPPDYLSIVLWSEKR